MNSSLGRKGATGKAESETKAGLVTGVSEGLKAQWKKLPHPTLSRSHSTRDLPQKKPLVYSYPPAHPRYSTRGILLQAAGCKEHTCIIPCLARISCSCSRINCTWIGSSLRLQGGSGLMPKFPGIWCCQRPHHRPLVGSPRLRNFQLGTPMRGCSRRMLPRPYYALALLARSISFCMKHFDITNYGRLFVR